MRESIGGMLAPLSDAIFGVMNAIPMWAVKAGVFGLLALLAVWVVSLPPQLPEGEKSGAKFSVRDLRGFAILVLALQAVLYIVF